MAVNQVMSPGDDAARFRNSAGSALNNFGGRSDSYNAANSTQSAVNQAFGSDQITPEPNVLDNFASYTYSASLYLMTIEDFQKIVDSGKKEFPGSQLLIQSAGAPVDGRNKYFSLDYYIERIVLESTVQGKGTGNPHNVTGIKMTVVEPNGITLVGNLDRAIQEYVGQQNKQTAMSSALYLLIIRFYGYDESGEPVQCGKSYGPGANSVIEKYYPIQITNLKFKVASHAVEYEIEAVPVAYNIPIRQNKGSIPFNIELGGQTVKDALIGPVNNTKKQSESDQRSAGGNAAPKKASASAGPKQTVRKGLIQMLNDFQENLVKQGKYTYPDVYSIEFTSDALEQAKILVHGGDTKGTGMPVNKTAADQTLPDKQSMDKTSRLVGFTAGTQIVQIIDQIMRNSTYVTDQANTAISEKTGEQVPNKSTGKDVAWYKINLQAVPSQYDKKRNDYAYNIKFIISPYKITKLISPYFDIPKYRGAHKQYNYWFTGLNTSVLSYEQEYNNLYQVLLTGSEGASGGAFVNDAIAQCYSARSGQSSQGAAGASNEIAASAADYLYSKSDYAEVTLQIVGDPGWLQQGEVFSMIEVDSGPFLSDGTINFDASDICFEILFNRPVDYNLDTGLMDPTSASSLLPSGEDSNGVSRQSVVYQAYEVVSEFSKGKFVQTLKGYGVQIFPDQSFKEAQNFGRETPTQSGLPSRDNGNFDLNNSDTAGRTGSNATNTPTSGSTSNKPNPRPVTSTPPKTPTSNGDLANLSFAQRSQIALGIGSVSAGFTGGPITAQNNQILNNAVGTRTQLINRET